MHTTKYKKVSIYQNSRSATTTTNYASNYPRLSNAIYTKPYNWSASRHYTMDLCCSDCRKYMSDCCQYSVSLFCWLIPFCIISSICVGIMVGAYQLIEVGVGWNQRGHEFNIQGYCQVIDSTKYQNIDDTESNDDGYDWSYTWKVYNLSICNSTDQNNFEISVDKEIWSIGDYEICYTDETCQYVFFSETNAYHKGAESLFGLASIIFLISFCCCVYCVRRYYRTLHRYQPTCFRRRCCDIRCWLCCAYVLGCDKRKWVRNQKTKLRNEQIFDYCMSYYRREYKVDLGDNIYDLIWNVYNGKTSIN